MQKRNLTGLVRLVHWYMITCLLACKSCGLGVSAKGTYNKNEEEKFCRMAGGWLFPLDAATD